ncbi:tryptophan--tRNA ligase [Candidatus Dojkabacteria bacterium]|uniref:Tryptophan--tRNA ligase n=1 Tax=Candidatus Dojkabacteria bacterium TaxID=2099670 RepID=A0A955I7M2_9BACT|nr:tryptophan--tRNA ligase [Candidatus Dojkabacteria bacterium]
MENKNEPKRILTGDRPTGPLHLGHFVGSLQNRVKLQNEFKTFIMVADVQALTDNYDNPEKVRDNVYQVIQDNIAAGIDPEKATFFIQSQIPQIAELTVFFMNLVSHAEVLRNPTVKTEIAQKGMTETVPFGFVGYPVSQAADIHIVRADLVPVGEDQAPMLELADKIGERFNRIYKSQVFHKVQGKFGDVARLVGTDGNAKMSKSLGNCIYLQDTPEQVHQRVSSMYTDPARIRATDPGKVEGNPVFIYHDAFNANKEEVEDLKQRYRAGKVGDVEVKQKLEVAINAVLGPIRERREKYPLSLVKQIAEEGQRKVLQEAETTMQMVREAMKIDY